MTVHQFHAYTTNISAVMKMFYGGGEGHSNVDIAAMSRQCGIKGPKV